MSPAWFEKDSRSMRANVFLRRRGQRRVSKVGICMDEKERREEEMQTALLFRVRSLSLHVVIRHRCLFTCIKLAFRWCKDTFAA